MLAVDGDGVGIGSTANQFSFRVVGHSEFGGSIVATAFTGDGSGLNGISVPQSGWTNYVSGGSSITYNTYQDGKIGIGTSTPSYHGLTIGSASADASVGIGTTNLYVNGSAYFNDELVVKNANVSGIVTAAGIDLQDSDGNITVGVVTATNINVGSSGTEFHVTTSAVAIGTATARSALDIVGHTRMTSYSEHVGELSIVGSAATVCKAGMTIRVTTGVYPENNPIDLPRNVSVDGDDLRNTQIVPLNVGKDMFHVDNGCLVQNLNFAGATSGTLVTGAAVAFPPLTNSEKAVSGYIALGPANEGPRKGNPAFGGRYKSPYVRNCTNFMTGSIGMKIDGNHVDAAYSGTNNLGQDIKSMVCDSFTQYNEAGIGVSITNRGYAQLVSIFTISCEKAIYCDSGGQCDLTNSNSSFGTFGLVADGVSGTAVSYTHLTLPTKRIV